MGGNVPAGKKIDLVDYVHAKPVQPMKMTLQCPGCLKGELVFTGMSSQTDPKQFQHRCECGHELAVVGKSYPHIAFEYISLEKPDDMDEADGVVARIGNEGGGGTSSGSGAADEQDPAGRRSDDGEDGGRVQPDGDTHPV